MFDAAYWTERYRNNDIPWDIGHACPAIISYFKQLKNKDLKVLIPGAGNAHEAYALNEMGFKSVYVLDISPEPIANFKKRYPNFPTSQVIQGDFFEHNNKYDIIVEQTFFCALPPTWRFKYVLQMQKLLSTNGKLVGVLFNSPLNTSHPPFGGSLEEYQKLFKEFGIKYMETNKEAIKPRANRELFILLYQKK